MIKVVYKTIPHVSMKVFKKLRKKCKDLDATKEEILAMIRSNAQNIHEKTKNKSNLDGCVKTGLPALVRNITFINKKRRALKSSREKLRATETKCTSVAATATTREKTASNNPS